MFCCFSLSCFLRSPADTALRFSQYFGTSAELWLGLQVDYDMCRAKRGSWPEIQKSIRPLRPKGKRNQAA